MIGPMVRRWAARAARTAAAAVCVVAVSSTRAGAAPDPAADLPVLAAPVRTTACCRRACTDRKADD